MVPAALLGYWVSSIEGADNAILGSVAGWLAGNFLFALIVQLSGGEWSATWGEFTMNVISCIAGGVLSKTDVLPDVAVSTSFIGSYLFMRSWTIMFPGNYPDDHFFDKLNGVNNLETHALFWLYVFIFLVTFTISIIFRTKVTNSDCYQQ